jgi:hypothetical protein
MTYGTTAGIYEAVYHTLTPTSLNRATHPSPWLAGATRGCRIDALLTPSWRNLNLGRLQPANDSGLLQCQCHDAMTP